MKQYKAYFVYTLKLILLFLFLPSFAETACSKASIEILQELTMERIAFDAKMVITNNLPDKDLTNVRVDVTIKDAEGNVKNDLFYTKVSSRNNISDVDGSGTVKAATAAEVHWLIIPSPGAGGSEASGKTYWVGATLTYSIDGTPEVVPINPDKITVKPEAQLILDYFLPYEVLGDNPFTSQVEAPVPFALAVRVLNAGYGTAKNLKIDSAQPKIVDNQQGLLVDFRLLGTTVNDSAVSPSLTVDIGDLDSKKIATANWEMISTLSGHFVEFDATFSHSSDLGGELTSLIKETNSYYFEHNVKVNLPGRDSRLDILADTDSDSEHLPDTIFESEIPGSTGRVEDARSPVKVVAVIENPQRPTAQSPNVIMKIQTGDSGWVYSKLDDPSKGMLKLQDVLRADGIHLDTNNFWIAEGFDSSYQKTYTLSLLDYRADASVTGTYTLVFDKPAEDNTAPTTNLIFDGPSKGTAPVYITPETKIIFSATDSEGGSGVDQMFRKIMGVDTDFIPALPMSVTNAGSAELDYYSIDRAGNKEDVKTRALYVDNAAPVIDSFLASPSAFMPQAPKTIAATRSMNFVIKATDDINSIEATVDIAQGDVFSDTKIVKTLTATLTSDVQISIPWDGKNQNNLPVSTGIYTARVKVTDGLNGGTTSHTSSSYVNVAVDEWFQGQALAPDLSGAQLYPEVAGTQVVWQDNRNGNWDIYTKDITGGSPVNITNNPADQVRPSISGNIIVWQDGRNGDQDIYGYDLSTGHELVICTDAGNQESPVVSGDWVAWQDDRAGNLDIYAYNLNTHQQLRITSHERDQMRPALSGTTLTWEDYRHGLGEIYKYDLSTATETRLTYDAYSQTLPTLSDNTIAWTDQRNGQRDIYYLDQYSNETRVTYGIGDHSQANLLNGVIVYTDYEAGPNDPNLAFFDTKTGNGSQITANPSRQEEPALGNNVLVWQDDREGIFQIYWNNFQMEIIPVQAEIKPGFNLVAVGDKLLRAYPKASDLISSDPNGLGIEKIVAYNSLNSIFTETSTTTDLVFQKGMGIGVYATGSGVLDVGDSGETGQYTLLPGVNYIGMLTTPNGYTAYNLISSIGLDNIQSVRRFNNQTGLWETASVRETASGKETLGVNFVIHQGEGLIITMKTRVDGWKP